MCLYYIVVYVYYLLIVLLLYMFIKGLKVPVRGIFNSPDMSHWLSSDAYKEILRFVRILSECSMGKVYFESSSQF